MAFLACAGLAAGPSHTPARAVRVCFEALEVEIAFASVEVSPFPPPQFAAVRYVSSSASTFSPSKTELPALCPLCFPNAALPSSCLAVRVTSISAAARSPWLASNPEHLRQLLLFPRNDQKIASDTRQGSRIPGDCVMPSGVTVTWAAPTVAALAQFP